MHTAAQLSISPLLRAKVVDGEGKARYPSDQRSDRYVARSARIFEMTCVVSKDKRL